MKSFWCLYGLLGTCFTPSGTPFVDFEQGCQLQPSLFYYYIFINSKFHFLILRTQHCLIKVSNRNTRVRYEGHSQLTLSVKMG